MAMLRRRACAVLVAALTATTVPLSAQLGAPNAAGVSIGHVHLTVAGVTFEVPYREVAQLGLKLAFIVDPVGTRIELTEGLAGR